MPRKLSVLGFLASSVAFAVLLFSVFPATAAPTATLVSDDFTYVDGNLVGNGGWANHSGSGSLIQVSGGQIVVTHGSGSREDASLAFANQTTGFVSANFDIIVDDPGSAIGGGDYEYFAHFKNGGTDFTARLDVVAPTGGGDYALGISSGTATAEAIFPTDFAYGDIVNVTISYDLDTGQGFLTINGQILSGSVEGAGSTIEAIAFRQSDSSSDETIRIDNLVVTDVAPTAVALSSLNAAEQAPTNTVLLITTLLLLSLTSWYVLRRRPV